MAADYAYIDVQGGLARVRNNKKLYRRMLQLFLESGERAALALALEQGDLSAAADVMHSIKGMTGNLSFTPLFELSTLLVEQLRKGDRDEEEMTRFEDIYEKTRADVLALAEEIDNEG